MTPRGDGARSQRAGLRVHPDGAALKLWVLGALLVGILLPVHTSRLGGRHVLCSRVVVGIVESSMARLRLLRGAALLLVGAGALAAVALFLTLR